MKVKRQKVNKKYMSVYIHSFGFRQPYQVLLDANFIEVARQTKKDLSDALPKLLGGQVRLMTTYCCYAELRKLGPEFRAAADMAKSLEKRRCTHTPAVPAAQCIREIVGATNENHYAVATEDAALRGFLRSIPATPLMYINKSVLILEPPSGSTLRKAQEMELVKTMPKTNEIAMTRAEEAAILEQPIKKRKRASEPNPLSIKRKKTVAKPPAPSASKAKSASTHTEAKSDTDDQPAHRERVQQHQSNDDDDDEGENGGNAEQPKTEKAKRKRKRQKKNKSGAAAEPAPTTE
ncbi:Fcf1-domain-containing protein [Entophlyctis helioformis]|nr:Fcf1-domain-containing protein [Entophlyctis helioformis]